MNGKEEQHKDLENLVVERIQGYMDFPTQEGKIRELIKPLVVELAYMREMQNRGY